jgi:AbrB family transcriptional regulator (stage V sporulation protein T)
MKATGIVRRIDDLGRVVVPKEIRRTLRIREGDPMEIFTDREGEIILKKYSPIGELSLFAQQYADAVHHSTGHAVCICDKDQVIAAAGLPRKGLIGLSIHSDLDALIEKRQTILAKREDADFVFPTQTFFPDYDFHSEAIATILCEGDAIGAVLIFSLDPQNPLGEPEKAQASTGAYFLGKQLEN